MPFSHFWATVRNSEKVKNNKSLIIPTPYNIPLIDARAVFCFFHWESNRPVVESLDSKTLIRSSCNVPFSIACAVLLFSPIVSQPRRLDLIFPPPNLAPSNCYRNVSTTKRNIWFTIIFFSLFTNFSLCEITFRLKRDSFLLKYLKKVVGGRV